MTALQGPREDKISMVMPAAIMAAVIKAERRPVIAATGAALHRAHHAAFRYANVDACSAELSCTCFTTHDSHAD